MKKIIIAIVALGLAFSSASGKSRVSNGWPYSSFTETDTIHSEVLGADRQFTIYLPAGYEKDTDRSYPVLYLLHGMSDTNVSWFEKHGLVPVADQLMASGEAQPMIIVSPNAGGDPAVEWNGYFDMPGWEYEKFFYDEFIPYIESAYRVKKGKEYRAISGLSMGGGGATSYAQRHPDMFSSAYAMSALMDIDAGNRIESAPDSKMVLLTKAVKDKSCVGYVRDADEQTVDALKSVAWYVDCGDDDFLLDYNLDFYKQMRAKGVPCQLRVRDGGHTSEYWRTALYESLPFASRNFGK